MNWLGAISDAVATPLASAPVPAKKDAARTGFDDDAWDVKPSKQPQTTSAQQPAPTLATAPAPQQPSLTGSMQELSLLSQPLEPTRVQPPAPAPQPQVQPQIQPQITQQQPQQQLPQVTPSFFQGIGGGVKLEL